MHIVANDREFDIDVSTPLLQALQQHGIAARFSCRNGNCGLCEARLNAGQVWLEDSRQLVDAPTTLLLCRAFARCDLNLKIDIAPRTLSRYCRVLRFDSVDDGYDVELQLPAGRLPTLSTDTYVRLEAGVSGRWLSAMPVANSQRNFVLRLLHEDTDWLEAIAQDGVRIEFGLTPA